MVTTASECPSLLLHGPQRVRKDRWIDWVDPSFVDCPMCDDKDNGIPENMLTYQIVDGSLRSSSLAQPIHHPVEQGLYKINLAAKSFEVKSRGFVVVFSTVSETV